MQERTVRRAGSTPSDSGSSPFRSRQKPAALSRSSYTPCRSSSPAWKMHGRRAQRPQKPAVYPAQLVIHADHPPLRPAALSSPACGSFQIPTIPKNETCSLTPNAAAAPPDSGGAARYPHSIRKRINAASVFFDTSYQFSGSFCGKPEGLSFLRFCAFAFWCFGFSTEV